MFETYNKKINEYDKHDIIVRLYDSGNILSNKYVVCIFPFLSW